MAIILFEPKMFVSCEEKQDEWEANALEDGALLPQKRGELSSGDMVRLEFKRTWERGREDRL